MTSATLIDRACRLLGLVEVTTAATETITGGTLITRALKALGVLEATETPTADDYADGLVALNTMLATWPNLTPIVFATTSTSLTLSSILVRAIPLSLAIEIASAYGATPSPTLIATAQQAAVDVRRRAVRDDGLAVLQSLLDRWDAEAHGLHITPASLSTTLTLPSGYEQALAYALALAFAPLMDVQPRPDVIDEAAKSLAIVRRNALETPERVIDIAVPGLWPTSRWNIDTGSY